MTDKSLTNANNNNNNNNNTILYRFFAFRIESVDATTRLFRFGFGVCVVGNMVELIIRSALLLVVD